MEEAKAGEGASWPKTDRPARIAIAGAGYVGLTTGTCLAELGNAVVVLDIVPERVNALKAGKVHFFEPGLPEMMAENMAAGRLSFTTDWEEALRGAEFCFIAVATPEGEDGAADLSAVAAAAEAIAKHRRGSIVVVTKSTVPPGTGDMVLAVLEKREGAGGVSVVSNPEFLREGSAIADFMRPDRVVVGSRSLEAAEKVAGLYAPLGAPVLVTPNIYTAEMVKYAANAFLATKISFVNEIALICERVGADAKVVAQGMGMDKRIGGRYLEVGLGWGGSCLTGEESVLIRRGGKVSLQPLARVYSEFEESDPPEVLAWEAESQRAVFRPVARATRREYSGSLIEVRTKMGRRVRCTPDHPMVTKAGVKLAGELSVEDWLPVALNVPTEGKRTRSFDLLEGLETAGLAREAVIVKTGEGVLAGVRPLSLQTVLSPARSYDVLRCGALRLHELDQLGLSSEGGRLKTTSNGTGVPRRLEADREFWRVVGLYLAEGHVTQDRARQRIQWSFDYRGEEDLVAEVAGYWARVGVKADVRHKPTTTAVVVSSRVLSGWWRGVLGMGRNAYDQKLPDAIWGETQEHKLALLSGYWQGDGCWMQVAGGPSVTLGCGTVSRVLADGLLRLLGEVGVVASLKLGRSKKSTCDTYFINISGADQVERLASWVGQGAEAMLASIQGQQKRIAPTGYRKEGANTAWVRVVETKRQAFEGAVYSLEVPGAHTFVSTGGLVAHNCLPKDTKALERLAQKYGYHPELLHAVIEINREQRMAPIERLRGVFETLDGRTVALWGLAFKPNTDDMREAPALDIANALVRAGASVRAYDPVAMGKAQALLPDVEMCADAYEAARGADAVVLVTEWEEFLQVDWRQVWGLMRGKVLVDGRNAWDAGELEGMGFVYRGLGRAAGWGVHTLRDIEAEMEGEDALDLAALAEVAGAEALIEMEMAR